MPYEPAGKSSGEFIGIISVEDWEGNFKKGYAVGKGGKITRVKLNESGNFSKASYSRTLTCWIFTWYGQNYSPGCECWGDIYEISSSTFCFEEGAIDEEVDGPTDDNYGGEGGTSGTDYTPPTPAVIPTVLDSLYKIMRPNDCLNTQQMQNLTTMFGSYLSGQGDADLACIQKAIYKKFEASGKKLAFCIKTLSIGNGAYDPATKTIYWGDEGGISVVSLFSHEFFHAYQDTHYQGGSGQYSTGTAMTGFPNIEFEAALYLDIVNGSASATGMGSGAPQAVKNEYMEWIATITYNNTKYPKQFSDFGSDSNNFSKYYYFLDKFYAYSAYANIGAKSHTLQPSALLNIFSTSNCK